MPVGWALQMPPIPFAQRRCSESGPDAAYRRDDQQAERAQTYGGRFRHHRGHRHLVGREGRVGEDLPRIVDVFIVHPDTHIGRRKAPFARGRGAIEFDPIPRVGGERVRRRELVVERAEGRREKAVINRGNRRQCHPGTGRVVAEELIGICFLRRSSRFCGGRVGKNVHIHIK